MEEFSLLSDEFFQEDANQFDFDLSDADQELLCEFGENFIKYESVRIIFLI